MYDRAVNAPTQAATMKAPTVSAVNGRPGVRTEPHHAKHPTIYPTPKVEAKPFHPNAYPAYVMNGRVAVALNHIEALWVASELMKAGTPFGVATVDTDHFIEVEEVSARRLLKLAGQAQSQSC